MKNKLVKKVFAVVMAAAVMAGNGVTTDVFAAPVATVFDATPTDGTSTKPADKGTELKDTTSKGEYTVTNADKGTVSYDGTTSKSSTVKIPSTIEVDGVKYKVTTIDDGAFKNNSTVKKVTINNNITTVGDNAFSGCKKLESVSLGKNVKEIGDNAFKGCTKLTKVTLPAKTNTIGANAFNGCKNLKTITITSTKLTSKTVDDKAFKGVPAGTVIKVPASKLKAYKKLFAKKGLSSKVKVVKA